MDKKVGFPRFGKYTNIIKDFLEDLGIEVVLPPPISKNTIKLGVECSQEMICYPYKTSLGSNRECLEKGANCLIMYETVGTCRFRHYAHLQEKTLKELGYDFEMYYTSWKHPLKIIKFAKELNPKINIFKIIKAGIKTYKKIKELEMKELEKNKGDINIGLVGEIYTILEDDINMNIEEKLQKLNVNVDKSVTLLSFLKHRLTPFHKTKVKREAKKLLKFKIGGHGFESVYNTMDYCKRNFDGIIHLTPLTCMPETTVSKLLDIICKKNNMPIMHLSFDDNKSEGLFKTRIEAFVETIRRKGNLNVASIEEKGYHMGIDTGSVSINFAIIDNKKNIIKTLYLENKGVVETIKEGFEILKKDNIKISSVGVTGSGKELTAMVVGVDTLDTEIIAHAIGTNHFVPDFKTIFEIGGEDSKIMFRSSNLDFNMNDSCGGGTGSMIKAIANRLGVSIEEVGALTLNSKNSLSLPGKCGLFCQSAVVHQRNVFDAKKEDLLKGVCEALIINTLSMLSQGKQLNPPFVFQGGCSLNIGIIKALEKKLGHKIIVPKYNTVMGAIGEAFLALEKNPEKTNFKGFDVSDVKASIFKRCGDCSNNCMVHQLIENGEVMRRWGSKCGKWNK